MYKNIHGMSLMNNCKEINFFVPISIATGNKTMDLPKKTEICSDIKNHKNKNRSVIILRTIFTCLLNLSTFY